MTTKELRKIITETIKDVLKENDNLTNDDFIPSITTIGKSWNTIVRNLDTLILEIEGFSRNFESTIRDMGMENELLFERYKYALIQMEDMMKELRPDIKKLVDIETKDKSKLKEHPHGRYAQQAGATPFETPQDF